MRFAKLAAALLLAFCALAAPAFAEVAVVDVARVIERSVPGKVGQQYIDNLRKSLNDELAAFAKSASKDKDAAQKTAQKQAELNARFNAEYNRVSSLMGAEVRKAVAAWLKANKKGVTLVVPAGAALGFKPEADVSGEILKRLNRVSIDFSQK